MHLLHENWFSNIKFLLIPSFRENVLFNYWIVINLKKV